MKKFIVAVLSLLSVALMFSQEDLQVLALVKLKGSESITVKELKTRVGMIEKQRGVKTTSADREKVLDAVIQEKLVAQAAYKSGIAISDSTVDRYFISQFTQAPGVSERELEDELRKQTGMNLEKYVRENLGIGVAEMKAYLKNQLAAQQYVIQKNQSKLQSIAPSDSEIRAFYELNKASFVWTDMAKLFVVMVPKNKDIEKARVKALELLKSYKEKKKTQSELTVESRKENSSFQAGEVLVNKTQQSAGELGLSYEQLLELFKHESGYISEVIEHPDAFIFCSVIKKYAAKMLSIDDVVQPESTVVVYEYIRNALSQRKQMEFLASAAADAAKELDTKANVDRKKTGKALEKLLNW